MYLKAKNWSGESLPWGATQMPFGSIGVRAAPYRKRFRSAFGLGAANCSVLPFGGQGLVSPECWCTDVGQTICDFINGPGTYAAAVMMNAQDVAYPSPPLPAAPPAVGAGTSTIPAPYTIPQYQAAVTDALTQGQQSTALNLSDFFGGVAANANDAQKAPGINWPLWIGVGAAGLLGFALLKGGR